MYQKYDHIYYIDRISCKVKQGTILRSYSDPERYDLVVGFHDHFYDYADYEDDFAWEEDIYLTEEAELNYNYYKDLKAKFEVK